MPRRKLIPDLEQLAARWGVSTRAIRRWHNSGANVHDPASVAELLLRQRGPSAAALAACLRMINDKPSSL
jgi:hypothetical protein